MGSGSYGGGGGAGGGGSSLSGGAGGTGGYTSKGGQMVSTVRARSAVEKEAKQVLSKLSKFSQDYLKQQFCSPLIRWVYEQLFEFSVHVFQDKSWQGVTERYGVPGSPGCLPGWAKAVMTRCPEEEPNEKVRDTAIMCLEDFLMLAMDNDVDLYLLGSSQEVLSNLNQNIFNSTSGYFLGSMIWRVLEREKEKLPPNGEIQLRQVAQDRADRIVHSFKGRFHAKRQTTYRDLFHVIQGNTDWFLKELRR